MAEIRSLHGASVAEIFSSGLEQLDGIEGIALSVLWKNGEVTAGCSNLSSADLALLVLALDNYQRRVLGE